MGVEELNRAQASVEAYAKIGVTDFLLIMRGDNPMATGEQLAAQLPPLRELS